MMIILTSQMSLLLLLLLSITTSHTIMCNNDNRLVRCNEKDQETLLTFKRGVDRYTPDPMSTWSTKKDCCTWKGVKCDNVTGRVTKLDLNNQLLQGEMNLCILDLEYLSYLDLSEHYFDVITIPVVQHNITHASNLIYLDISATGYSSLGLPHIDNLHWLSPLSSLKYLNLSGIDLHKETNWLQILNTLPSLLEVQLSNCKLGNFMINPSIAYLNLSSLVTLELFGNNFTSHLPNGFFNLTKHINYLDLSYSNIHGEIPSSLLNLPNLRQLYLSNNQLQGPIPDKIGQLAHIQDLDLSSNMLSGSIPSTLGNLSSLNDLSIGSNRFSGEISNLTFSKLSSLDSLDMSSSTCVFQFDLNWVPPFQLSYLSLENTTQGPNFPSWIYTQKSLQFLDLSSSGISFIDRSKFLRLIEGIYFVYLSYNSMTEDISNLTLMGGIIRMDHNNFTGGLPNISPIAAEVDLSYNSFSGSIPRSWKNLEIVNLWSNKLSGEVPMHLSNWYGLQAMNLGENEFSGTIPIKMSQDLQVLILRANQFEGTIPTQLFNLSKLYHLDLVQNKLSGYIPECVYNLSHMVIDSFEPSPFLGNRVPIINLFTKGHDYVFEVHSNRRTVDLSANSLSGEVPLELFQLVQVQSLNLSHNNLTGTIPKMIGGMKNMESLDLSNNKFFGEIPRSMALITYLEVLNLSCNNFNGKIPIGTQLQSFDASSYIGNPRLCGAPLKNCTAEEENHKKAMPSRGNEDDESIRESLYLGMGVGFAVGFWGVCGPLFLIRKWRNTYYRFIDGVGDKFYVTLMVKLNNFHRNRAPTN